MTDDFDAFLDQYRRAGRGKTAETYRYLLKPFAAWLEGRGKSASDFTAEDVRAYLDEKSGWSANSKNTFLAAVKRFSKWFVVYRLDPSKPEAPRERQRCEQLAALMRFRGERRARRRALTLEELQTLLDVAEPRDAALIYILAYFGLRKGELKRITRIDFSTNTLGVLTEKTKVERLLPFDETTARVLMHAKRNGWLDISPSWLNQRLARYDSVLDGVHLHPHLLRSTFNTHMRNALRDDGLLRVLMGHAERSMTDVYDETFESEIREAMTTKHYMRGLRVPKKIKGRILP